MPASDRIVASVNFPSFHFVQTGAAVGPPGIPGTISGSGIAFDNSDGWAITGGTSLAAWVPFIGDQVSELLLGGPQVSSATLLRFYVLHVAVLPTVLVMGIVIHLWRWRKDSTLDSGGDLDG